MPSIIPSSAGHCGEVCSFSGIPAGDHAAKAMEEMAVASHVNELNGLPQPGGRAYELFVERVSNASARLMASRICGSRICSNVCQGYEARKVDGSLSSGEYYVVRPYKFGS